MKRRALTSTAASLAIVTLAAACDSTPPRGPGSIFISASTQMLEPNFFQYVISVDDGSPRQIDAFENVSYFVNGLAHGPHKVVLSGLPTGCGAGTQQRDVNLRGDDTVLVVYNVQCARTSGDLRVNVTTTGPNPDPDGYLIYLDEFPAALIQTNGQVTLQFMPTGSHSVMLSGVAANCSASAAQSIAITAGVMTTTNFTVTCSPVAIVKFVATSTGPDRDVDGLTFKVNAGAATRVAAGTTYLRMAAGTHTWEIGDLQPNCTLSGGTTGSVTIAANDTATITAAATCVAIGYGTAGTSATDPAADTLANGQNDPDAAHDILQVTTRYASNWLILVMRFARPVGSAGIQNPGGLQGLIELDVDENVSTGFSPLLNSFGGNAQQGVDYGILLFDADSTSVRIQKSSAGSDTTVHRVPLKLEGDSVIVRIPIAKLGGDDGNMTITTIIGTVDRPTDIAPNSGVILARPAAGAVVANAVSGVDAAPGQKARPRRSVSWPPR